MTAHPVRFVVTFSLALMTLSTGCGTDPIEDYDLSAAESALEKEKDSLIKFEPPQRYRISRRRALKLIYGDEPRAEQDTGDTDDPCGDGDTGDTGGVPCPGGPGDDVGGGSPGGGGGGDGDGDGDGVDPGGDGDVIGGGVDCNESGVAVSEPCVIDGQECICWGLVYCVQLMDNCVCGLQTVAYECGVSSEGGLLDPSGDR